VQLPRKDESRNRADSIVATDDAAQLADEAGPLVESAVGVQWYEFGSQVDRAASTLCRLRRARAGEFGGAEHGDAAVRATLAESSHEAVVWIASRAISYMDETGFPESVELWFPPREV
jgi:hypothetical protein